jgi:hypothetical protein
MMPVWTHLVVAAVLNMATIYYPKASQGMTADLADDRLDRHHIFQWLMAHSMHFGAEMATTTIVVVVSVMIGPVIIGYFAGDRPSGWRSGGG